MTLFAHILTTATLSLAPQNRICWQDAAGGDQYCVKAEAVAPSGTKTLFLNIDSATCSGDAGGGALTINGSDEIVCSADDASGGGTLVGDVDGPAGSNDLDEAAVEAELESVIDLADLQGAVTDSQVPDTITVDLATTAATANAGDTATAFFASGTVEVARGGTGAAPGAGDQVLVSDSTSAGTWRAVPDCGESGTLNYTAASNTFSCLTDGGGGGNAVEVSVDLGATMGTAFSSTVTGQAWVTSTSAVACAPSATTADGQVIETYRAAGFNLSIGNLDVGVGFDIFVESPRGATGVFRFRCTGV